MPFLSLPAEILSRVGDFLLEPELKDLAQTSHRLHDVFDRILYRSARCESTTRAEKTFPLSGILRAAETGNLEAIRKFISVGADVNQQHPELKGTALNIAADKGHNSIIEILLDAGADVTISAGAGTRARTPLDTAILSHNHEMLEIFLRGNLPKEALLPKCRWTDASPTTLRPVRKRAQLLLHVGEIPKSDTYDDYFDNLILFASLDADVDDLRDLIRLGMQSSPTWCVHNRLAFWAAILHGNVDLVGAFLDAGMDINSFSNEHSFPPPLCSALWNRDIKMARFLYEKGAHLTYPEDQVPDLLPVLAAAASGDVAMLDFVISLDADAPTRSNSQSSTALHEAVAQNALLAPPILRDLFAPRLSRLPMLQRLIELGIDVNSRDVHNLSALVLAAAKGLVEETRLLLENGAVIDVAGAPGPLHPATDSHVGVMEVLLQHGANPDEKGNYSPPLCFVKTAEAASLLVKYGANLEKPDRQSSPLNCAAERGSTEVMAVLLKAGASLKSMDEYGHLPLHNAILSNVVWKRLPMVKLLLDYGAPINEMGGPQCSGQALCHAVTPPGADQEGPDEVLVETLLKQGADIHSFTEDGQNCLHDACVGPFVRIVRLLLKYGADVTQPTKCGKSALHLATDCNRPEIVSLLVEHGAPLDEQMKNGKTPLFLAVEKRLEQIVAILLAHGASPNISRKNRTAPLHIAAGRGQERFVSMLLDRGAEINVKDRKGNDPLTLAARCKKESVVSMLRRHAQNQIFAVTREKGQFRGLGINGQ